MPTTLFDGSLAGLLSVVFEVFARGLVVGRLERAQRYAPGMFGEPVTVATDGAHARRVWEGLGKFRGFDRELVLRNWLFDTTESDTDIVHLMVRMFREQSVEASEDYRDEAIFRCKQVHKKMFREIHRMHAFVRFAEAEDGLYFARIDPDFDVLPLAVEHFEERYQDQEWMIWDGKRNYGFWFTPGNTKSQRVEAPTDLVSMPAAPTQQVLPQGPLPSHTAGTAAPPANESPAHNTNNVNITNTAAHEDGFQRLWGTYFDSVNIEARKNPKLHKMHVPPRYWRYLTEKRPWEK